MLNGSLKLSVFATCAVLLVNCAPKKSGTNTVNAASTPAAPAAETTIKMVDEIGDSADHLIGVYKGTMLKERKECEVSIEKVPRNVQTADGKISHIASSLFMNMRVVGEDRFHYATFDKESLKSLKSPRIVLDYSQTNDGGLSLILRQFNKTELHLLGSNLTAVHSKTGSIQLAVFVETDFEIHCINLQKK